MIRQGESISAVACPLAGNWHGDRQYDGFATGGLGPLYQRSGECPIPKDVKLKPDGSGGYRHNFLDRGGRKGCQGRKGLGSAGRLGGGNFSVWVGKALKRRGS